TGQDAEGQKLGHACRWSAQSNCQHQRIGPPDGRDMAGFASEVNAEQCQREVRAAEKEILRTRAPTKPADRRVKPAPIGRGISIERHSGHSSPSESVPCQAWLRELGP